jgi:hypothetical protein
MNDTSRMNNGDLGYFLKELDVELESRKANYGVEDGNLALTAIGGTVCLPYNTNQDLSERKVNDLDFAVAHTGHPNGDQAYLESQIVEEALGNMGFEFTQSTVDGYNPSQESTQTLTNVDPDINGLPITNLDLVAGEAPLGKYPQDWISEYSEPVAQNIRALDIEGITARKLFRATVDRQGPEDDSQEFDLGVLVGHASATGTLDEGRTERAWNELLEANEDKKKPWHEARGYFKSL